ncbi:triose-phosphate isomerase [bacterium]|nr:triose-phosphate isomerase [bacterium]
MTTGPTPLIAANWKSNQYWEGCVEFINELKELLPEQFDLGHEPPVDVLICPPFPYIPLMGMLLEEATIYLGAQDVSRFDGGAYTGDVSAAMLADLECDYCIVGHSERRNVFSDTDELIAQKILQLIEQELVPILCVGESLETRDTGQAVDFTLGQLSALKTELGRCEADRLVIAYEPLWAIGTGRNAEPADAQEMCAAIRDWLRDNLRGYEKTVPILYGGSVKPENAAAYFCQTDIDGALVGGASLKANLFAQLVRLYKV